MSQHEFTLNHHFSAPIDVVFDALADHEHFAQLWPGKTERIREAADEPNGVGSVRRIHTGLIAFEETTVTHQRPGLIEYTITRGSPLRNHWGRMELTADADGTQLHYVIRFDCVVPLLGKLLVRQLKRDFYANIEAWAAGRQARK